MRDGPAVGRVSRVLFVSTNSAWGGSEILWSQAASRLLDRGVAVGLCVRYPHPPPLARLRERGALLYSDSSSRFAVGRLLGDVRRRARFLHAFRPDLVIMSMGNHLATRAWPQACRLGALPYALLFQL